MCAFVLGERLTPIDLWPPLWAFWVFWWWRVRIFPISIQPLSRLHMCGWFAWGNLTTKILTRTRLSPLFLFWLTVLQAIFGIICAGYDGVMDVPRGSEWLWCYRHLWALCAFLHNHCLAACPATIVTPFEFLRLPLITFVGAVMAKRWNGLSLSERLWCWQPIS